LPFSAKSDGDLYNLKSTKDISFDFLCSPNDKDYYDIEFEITKYQNHRLKTIGRFTDNLMSKFTGFIGEQEWEKLINSVTYFLQIPFSLENSVVYKNAISSKLLSFCKLNFKFVGETSDILDEFFTQFNISEYDDYNIDSDQLFIWTSKKYETYGAEVLKKWSS
jgi:hypothetical protein